MSDSKSSAKIASFILGPFFGGAVFYWYNHVLYWSQYSYWQWVVVAIGYLIAVSLVPWAKAPSAILAITCIIAQFLSWAGMIQLPLIQR